MPNSRHPGRPKSTDPKPPCKFEGCGKTTEGGAKGFCHTHYIYTRRGIIDVETGQQLREFERVASYGPASVCSVSGCGRTARASNMCDAHWQRSRKSIPVPGPIQPRSMGTFVECLVAECPKRANSRGMCAGHAEQRARGLLDEAGNMLREPYSMGRGRPRTQDRWVGREGYALVRAPEGHPRARQDGSILEHRLVMEAALGRYLEEWEIVHHKNGDRSDNSLENLEIMDGRSRHGVGHPPGSEFDTMTAAQVLLQQADLPEELRRSLLLYRDSKVS